MLYRAADSEALKLAFPPLSPEAIESQCHAIGQLSTSALDLITGVQPDHTTRYLMQFGENKTLRSRYTERIDYDGAPLPHPEAQAYRVGALVGVAALRKEARANGLLDVWPERTPRSVRAYVRADRHAVPDRVTLLAGSSDQQTLRRKLYLDQLLTGGYAQQPEALEQSLQALQRRSHKTLGSLFSDKMVDEQDLIGYMYTGLAEAWELRRELMYEQLVAPSSVTVYDESAHFIPVESDASQGLFFKAKTLGSAVRRYPERAKMLRMREPVEGVLVEDQSGQRQTRWGETVVRPHDKILAVHRGILGFVFAEPGDPTVVPAIFRASQETWVPEEGAELIRFDKLHYSALAYPFVEPQASDNVAYGEAEVLAVVSEGAAPFIANSYLVHKSGVWPQGDREDLEGLNVHFTDALSAASIRTMARQRLT